MPQFTKRPGLILTLAVFAGAAAHSARAQSRLNPPLRLGALGIEIALPEGSLVQNSTEGDQIDLSVTDGATPARWSFRLLVMESPIGDASASDQISYLIESRRPVKTDEDGNTRPTGALTVLSNDPILTENDQEARLCLVRQTVDSGSFVFGWYCRPIGDGLTLLARIQVRDDSIRAVQRILSGSFATVRVPDLDALAEERRILLDGGTEFITSFTGEDLKSLVGTGGWFRTFRPASARTDGGDGEQEIGCYVLEAIEAPRGAVNPGRDPLNYTPSEKTPGLLVRIWGHALTDDPEATMRSEAYYWMNWDNTAEVWSVHQTLAYRGRTQSSAISGVREPGTVIDPGGTIQVIVHRRDGTDRIAPPATTVPDSYFPQPLRWLEGPLFKEIAKTPARLGYYCVDTSRETVAITPRIDEIAPIAPGRWQLRSRPRTDGPVTETTFADDGTMLRRTWPDGSVTEPIELDELLAIWQRKGIATEPVRVRRDRSPSSPRSGRQGR